MIIEIAKNSGFCFGVKKAVGLAEKLLSENENVYSYGPVIHNERVTDDLEKRGLRIAFDLHDIKEGETVIIRSHGVPKHFYAQAEERKIKIIDATCPYVKRIQQKAQEGYKQGRQIVIVGDQNHPEVIGINGWCGNAAIMIHDVEMAKTVRAEHLYVLAQTTITEELWEQVISVLKENNSDIEADNTICDATQTRQKSCEELAKRSDAMIILGGRNSSNTNKLFRIAEKFCKKTFFVEGKEDLSLNLLADCDKIGIVAGASTPEHIIKEVIAAMSDKFTERNEENLMHQFMDEIDKSLKLPNRGEIIKGEVIQVTGKEVVVNLGCKKDGILPKDEISFEGNEDLTSLFKVGDVIDAKVVKTDDGDGNILLSRKKLEVGEHWEEINAAIENKTVVSAKVVKEVKGGVIAVYKEVSGFIPLSQLSDRFVEKVDEFLGKTIPVKVTQVNQKKNKAVFSHKAYLLEERSRRVEEIWAKMSVGDIVDGVVMRFTDYGAFVDIGGLDGLLHISEISWGKLKNPQEMLKINQNIKVKILSMNREKEKISLGLKQTTPEPWETIDDHYKAGDIVTGKVVQLKEYGAFVELQPGMDGLVHISEIAHKHVTSPAHELKIGQEITAKILEIDKEKRRISLSIKETLDLPPDEILAAKAEKEQEPEYAPGAEKFSKDVQEKFDVEETESAFETQPAADEEVEQTFTAEEEEKEEEPLY